MDINTLTIGEAATVEKMSGYQLSQLDGGFPMLVLAGFAFVINKRTNPEYTWEEALNIPLSELNEQFGGTVDDDDPKE